MAAAGWAACSLSEEEDEDDDDEDESEEESANVVIVKREVTPSCVQRLAHQSCLDHRTLTSMHQPISKDCGIRVGLKVIGLRHARETFIEVLRIVYTPNRKLVTQRYVYVRDSGNGCIPYIWGI